MYKHLLVEQHGQGTEGLAAVSCLVLSCWSEAFPLCSTSLSITLVLGRLAEMDEAPAFFVFFLCLACATLACCVGIHPRATPLQICFRLLCAGAGRPVPLQSCHSSQFLPGGDPFCVLLQCRWRKFFVTLAATRGIGRLVCPRRPARASSTTDQSCRRCASRVQRMCLVILQ